MEKVVEELEMSSEAANNSYISPEKENTTSKVEVTAEVAISDMGDAVVTAVTLDRDGLSDSVWRFSEAHGNDLAAAAKLISTKRRTVDDVQAAIRFYRKVTDRFYIQYNISFLITSRHS